MKKLYREEETRLANMIAVGVKHNWDVTFTDHKREGCCTITKENVKVAFNKLCELEGRNHAVNNDQKVIKSHRRILAGAISIKLIHLLSKEELNEVDEILSEFAYEIPEPAASALRLAKRQCLCNR